MQDAKDNRLKYVEMVTVFRDRASAIDFQCKLSQRSCERLAKHIANDKPKSAKEFERHEYLKDFILKTSTANETTIELLAYMKDLLQSVCDDARDLSNIAALRDIIKFDQQTIAIVTQQRNDLMDELAAHKRNIK